MIKEKYYDIILKDYLDLNIHDYGNKYYYYYYKGKSHREDGPAIEYTNGNRCWYQHNKLSRLDGPAIDCNNGYKSWYYQGQKIECTSQEEFKRLIKLKAFW